MNKKLYDLMNWPEIEGVVYSDTKHPKKLLGGHMTSKGFLIQAFRPGAVKAFVKDTLTGEIHAMDMADEEGYFAVLIKSKTEIFYTLIYEFKDKTREETVDLYNYPSSVEVCLRVKPGTSKDFAEHLMKLSVNQLSVGNLFILKVHDYEDIRNDFQQESYNQVQVRFWMMGFLLLNILLGIVGTFWFRTQHRRAESALRIAVGASRMQLWQRLNKEGLLLLTLAALPAAVICYNIGHLELTEGYMEWGVVRFLITFVITYFLMSLMILVGIWFPARQVIRIHPAEALREE